VPSSRLLSVVILVGMGAVVAAAGGNSEAGEPGSSLVKGSVVSNSSPAARVGAAASFDVRAENRLAGTPGWRIRRVQGNRPGLQAYAGAVSALPGQRVPLAVSGRGPVRVRALRIGWYDGVGARQVWQGTLQARPEPANPADWQARGWADTNGWPEGHYLLRLDQDGVDRQQVSRYLPLTIRSANAQGDILVLASPLTWQAENETADLAVGAALTQPASFDRPYTAGYGSGGFLADDAGIVQLAERTGRRLAYATDYDLATDPTLATKAAAVLTGNSQYWTTSLRGTIRTAAAAGTNLAFFGAGTGSRQVRLLAKGRTLEISDAAPSDSVRVTGLRPSCTKATQSDPGAGWTISNADWWGYKGAEVRTGDVVPGLVAGGADRAATSAAGSPKPMQILSLTRISCGAESDYQSAAYQVRPSGAGVFAAGTGRWACVVADTCLDQNGRTLRAAGRTQQLVLKVTLNVIEAFSKADAGERFPARDSAALYASLR
jgi:hypothetical protein